ncbi:MAG: ATP-grasp domain-containing protein, partial [Shewanella sp.]
MITKKVILLLGASSDQLFAIKTAKEMGLHTIVVDGDKLAPGFSLSDEHFVISTRDIDALKCFIDEYQQKRKIDAVSVMGSDIPQYVAELAAYIGVPHIPIESALLTTNKLAMKKHFLMHSIPIPWFSEVDDFQHLLSIIDERGLPIIIKPLDRSGARGVFLIKEVKNLE